MCFKYLRSTSTCRAFLCCEDSSGVCLALLFKCSHYRCIVCYLQCILLFFLWKYVLSIVLEPTLGTVLTVFLACLPLVVRTVHNKERHVVAKAAGQKQNQEFAEADLLRPNILHFILKQGYGALWSDSDVVWIQNPLPLLPEMGTPSAVRTSVLCLASK